MSALPKLDAQLTPLGRLEVRALAVIKALVVLTCLLLFLRNACLIASDSRLLADNATAMNLRRPLFVPSSDTASRHRATESAKTPFFKLQFTSASLSKMPQSPAWQLEQLSSAGATSQVTTNSMASARYVTSTWNWSQRPPDDLGTVGIHTIHLSPCPLGLDISHNTNAQYGVYIGGTGRVEVAPVTGGNCQAGSESGTIIVSTAYAHVSGYSVGSASSGIQEAINDSGQQRGTIYLLPASSGVPNYKVYSTVFLNTAKTLLSGYGALVQCFTRSACIINGNYGASTGRSNTIAGIEFMPGVDVDGVQIQSISASNGTYTITTATNHPFVIGDYVILFYSSSTQTQEGRFKVTSVPTAKQFTYSVGKSTISSTRAYGWAAIENTAIEDTADHVTFRDIKFASAKNGHFHWGMVVGNDQSFKLDGLTAEGHVIRCGLNFCGALVYARGDQGMAPVVTIEHLEASMQCSGNGVRYAAGNSAHIVDSVIQGFSQYGIYYAGGLQPLRVEGVYQESGAACANPAYPGNLASNAGIVTNKDVSIVGDDPIGGGFPSFVAQNRGAQVNNYYVDIHSSAQGNMGMFYIGGCSTSGAGNCTTYWPEPDLAGLGTVTYDVLKTVGTAAIPPNGTGSYAIATEIDGSCNAAGLCTYVDGQTGTSTYTVSMPSQYTRFTFWPGAVVLGLAAKLNIGTCGNAWPIISSNNLPSVFCDHSYPSGAPGQYTPYWSVVRSGDSVGNANPTVGAVIEQTGPASGAAISGVTGVRGFLNLNTALGQTDMYTFAYTNPFLTLATPGYRPLASPTDTAIGFDSAPATRPKAAQLGLRAPVAISEYIGSVFDNNNYKERLTATAKTFNVPVRINGDLIVTGKCSGCSGARATGILPAQNSVSLTKQTATIASSILCPASSCSAGLYRITYYVDSESACPETGGAGVSLNIAWKDETTARTVRAPLAGQGTTGDRLSLGSTSNFGNGAISVWSSGDAGLTYSTSYNACSSGLATYALHIVAEKVQ